MTKDQGQKPAHNDSSLQTDDNQTNGTESSLNNNCELTQWSNDGLKPGDTNKKDNVTNGRNKTVCYDFIKGNCRRRFCRFPHVMSADQVVFCHDFQNGGCFRNSCRFIHRSIEDEEFYRQCGSFPPHPEHLPPPSNAPPNVVSNHPPPQFSSAQANAQQMPPHYYPRPRDDAMSVHSNAGYNASNAPSPPSHTQMGPNSRRRPYGMVSAPPPDVVPAKRSHIDDSFAYNQQHSTLSMNGELGSHHPIYDQQQPQQTPNNAIAGPPATNAQPATVGPPTTLTSVVIGEDIINIYRLYEEHNLLRRRVEINEERLQELRATNTYLLHQNEQLRRQTQCSCTSTIVNPVTLTTTSQPQPAQVLNAVSIAPVHMQSTPIVSIASIAGAQPTQIIASTPSLAIATQATQGQQLALASTQPPTQILGTSQITLAPAQSMGIINTSQPLAMSANATQPIISYPVMTHSILPH